MIHMNTTTKPSGNSRFRKALSMEKQPLFGTAAILAGGKSSRMGFDKQLAK